MVDIEDHPSGIALLTVSSSASVGRGFRRTGNLSLSLTSRRLVVYDPTGSKTRWERAPPAHHFVVKNHQDNRCRVGTSG